MSRLKEILANPLLQNLLKELLPLLIKDRTSKETNQPTLVQPALVTEAEPDDTQTTPVQQELPEPKPPAKYFTLKEFQCTHCGQLPANGMNPVLLCKLDQLRERLGAPLYISSGYRCITHNAAVGGVSNSQHIYGNAADIYTDIMDATHLAELCKEIGFDGIGLYAQSDFVHVDVRDDGNSPGYYVW